MMAVVSAALLTADNFKLDDKAKLEHQREQLDKELE